MLKRILIIHCIGWFTTTSWLLANAGTWADPIDSTDVKLALVIGATWEVSLPMMYWIGSNF